ncbi:hypothetical protein DGo_PE0011 (plasmid) [Deinococcus gobiensis I-0]|uniref:Uncharacterized protein n=1 Tax=Deinococcus gobiensis (strain DSM 21396 / JCM 16679 / CGMCC 1.7299 / I-0) TaxID=745776 RepID=H8H3Q8_DEIGI|nr:hypothetical protein DGo_PE0011 [Deinococcus gobiensis I-0]
MDRTLAACRELRPGVPHRRGDGPWQRTGLHWMHPRSPQAWGWTAVAPLSSRAPHAFPTGVGMDRQAHERGTRPTRVPHRRGDGPCLTCATSSWGRRSPQAWGWTGYWAPADQDALAFPTGVGMDRRPRRWGAVRWRVPHRRGDGPWPGSSASRATPRSPQAWGWTVAGILGISSYTAFPTGVGMDRLPRGRVPLGCGVPHRRGDGPSPRSFCPARLTRSPQAWGWTGTQPSRARLDRAFPTGVGMDP